MGFMIKIWDCEYQIWDTLAQYLLYNENLSIDTLLRNKNIFYKNKPRVIR